VLHYPSVADARAQIASCRDGSLPLEPYQLVSQNALEPLLKEIAEATPGVTLRYGCRLVDFVQDEAGVSVRAQRLDGSEEDFGAAYLAGCDGGVSTVRKKLGIQFEGQGSIRNACQVIFRSKDLYERIAVGKGRHYNFAWPRVEILIVQGSRTEFTLHTSLPPDTDFDAVIRDVVGFPCEIEIRHVLPWRHHLLVAERYRDRRVFLAGDSAHLVIPFGGLGMNTGVADAIDLAWKLAGVIKGWGGPGLLDGYERERRPVGLRNRDACRWATEGVIRFRQTITPDVRDDTPEGAAARTAVAHSAKNDLSRMHDMRGVEFGYSYAGSPLIADDAENIPEWDARVYTPHARPGVRVPHMWLKDGHALQDALSDGYTLLDLTGWRETGPLEDAFRRLRAPLEVLHLEQPHLPEAYGCEVLLLRPDLHIAWCGDSAPGDAVALAGRVTGWASGLPSEGGSRAALRALSSPQPSNDSSKGE
jgi:2-polyprenyl-6-methoxyphenol hydroxylase-like FAD-dependent oxidoreductase